ncbi:MAG: recombinase family protein [Bacillota bacterium]|nr:recombinase family protein [Bacillota bacterium]
MANSKKCLAYIRVSRLGRAKGSSKFKDKESPQTQLEHIRRHCELKGYEIVNIYEDLDYSGGNDARPDFQRMFHEVRKNSEICAVIVYSLSRFARDVLDLNKYLVELEKYNVDFVSVTEEFLRTDTMYGKFLINIIGAVAQLQREQIAENVRDNMRNKALRGQYLGGIPPFGYSLNEETQKYEIIGEEAEIVRLIFNKYLNGDGLLKIRNYLNKNSVLGRNDYSIGTLQSILKNIHYTGDYVYSKRRNISRTKKKKTAEDEWIVVENNHSRIISKEEFLLVQKLMKLKNRAKPENLDKRVYGNQLLSGILQCDSCGHTYYHGPRRNGSGNKFDYYVCGGYKTKGQPFCLNRRGLRIDRLDPLIIEGIEEILNKERFFQMYQNTLITVEDELSAHLNEIDLIKTRITEIKEEQSRYLKLVVRTDNEELIEQYENEINLRNQEVNHLGERLRNTKQYEEQNRNLIKIEKLIKEIFKDYQLPFIDLFKLDIKIVGPVLKTLIKNVIVLDEEEKYRTKLTIQFAIKEEELLLLKKLRGIKIKSEHAIKDKLPEEIRQSLQDVYNEYKKSVYLNEYGPPVSIWA